MADMADYEFIAYEREDGAVLVRLDRPGKRNALNAAMLEELIDAIERAEDESGVRAVVLAGSEEAFSSGYDFGDGDSPTSVEEWLTKPYDHVDLLSALDLPVIAAVDGYALAGGCNLALACDIVIATDRAEFGFPDVRMGMLPPRLVLPSTTNTVRQARELLYTGKRIDARRAEQFGLVNRVVDPDELMDEARAEVDAIRKTPGALVTLLKRRLNDIEERQGSDPAGQIDQSLMALSAEFDAVARFNEIQDEEGIRAAIEWMHGANKD